MYFNIVLKKDGRVIQSGFQTLEAANRKRLDFARPNLYEVAVVFQEYAMTSDNAAAIAKGLSAEEWGALERLSVGKTIITSEFVTLASLELADMTTDEHEYITAKGRAVVASHTHTGEGKPATITSKEFVEQGYAAKITNRECIVWRNSHRDEQIITIRKSGFDNCPIEVIRPYDAGIYESASIDDATYEVQWLNPQLARPQSAPVEGSGVDMPNPFDEIDGVGYAVAMLSAEFIGKKDTQESVWSHLKTIEDAWQKALTELRSLCGAGK